MLLGRRGDQLAASATTVNDESLSAVGPESGARRFELDDSHVSNLVGVSLDLSHNIRPKRACGKVGEKNTTMSSVDKKTVSNLMALLPPKVLSPPPHQVAGTVSHKQRQQQENQVKQGQNHQYSQQQQDANHTDFSSSSVPLSREAGEVEIQEELLNGEANPSHERKPSRAHLFEKDGVDRTWDFYTTLDEDDPSDEEDDQESLEDDESDEEAGDSYYEKHSTGARQRASSQSKQSMSWSSSVTSITVGSERDAGMRNTSDSSKTGRRHRSAKSDSSNAEGEFISFNGCDSEDSASECKKKKDHLNIGEPLPIYLLNILAKTLVGTSDPSKLIERLACFGLLGGSFVYFDPFGLGIGSRFTGSLLSAATSSAGPVSSSSAITNDDPSGPSLKSISLLIALLNVVGNALVRHFDKSDDDGGAKSSRDGCDVLENAYREDCEDDADSDNEEGVII